MSGVGAYPGANPPLGGDGRKAPSLKRLSLLVFAANVAVRALVAATSPILHKEAYFWEWSRFPSLGYLEHPPLVAWILWGCRAVFPERAILTVRCGALIMGTLSFAAIWALGKRLFRDEDTAPRAMLVALALPVLTAAGFLMLPDSPLLLCHLLATLFFVRAIETGSRGDWALTGLTLGLALLSKFMAVLTVASFAVFFLACRPHRRWLLRWEPYAALLLALVVWAPFLWWNAQNEWASFAFQLGYRHRGNFGFELERVGEYVLEQVAAVGVLLMVPIVAALFVRSSCFPEAWRPAVLLLKCQIVTVLGFFLVTGSISETHPHWTILAYAPAALLLAGIWSARPRSWIARSTRPMVAVMIGAMLLLGLLSAPTMTVLGLLKPEAFGERWGRKIATAQVRTFGWTDLAQKIELLAADLPAGPETRIFGHAYRQLSTLSFHWDGEPIVNVDAFEAQGRRMGAAQWFYLPREGLRTGEGIFITHNVKREAPHIMSYFRSAEPLAFLTKQQGGVEVSRYRAFRVGGLRDELLQVE